MNGTEPGGAETRPADGQDERIRVMYVIWSLQMGGAERVVADLARSLDRRRFQPLVCCLNFKGGLAEGLEAEGIPVFALDKGRGLDFRIVPRLVRLMRRERVDVVHTHLWTSSFWGRVSAALARVPVVVVTEHNLDTWRRFHHFLADRLLGAFTDDWLFVSQEVETFYRERLGLAADRGHRVYNGVDLAPFDPPRDQAAARVRLGLPGPGPVIGTVGRLEERKGHRYFLEAMVRVLARFPQARGILVGEGKERPALEARCRELGLTGKVLLPGFCPDLADAFAALDVFVLPSLMEGHPLAALEAMAARRPVVATAVGGTAEAVQEGTTACLVPPADPERLAEAILGLLADPARAAEMGRAGRAWLEQRFSLPATVRANEEIYERRIAEKRRRRVA